MTKNSSEMSAILTSVLKLTVGILFNKIRDQTANQLKEGDLTDEKCRQFIVRELDDIKSKLDALIRKDLLSSVEFFRDGMSYLEMAVQDSGSLQPTGEEAFIDGAPSLNIHIARGPLNVTSEERFNKAKDKFKTAGEEATRAFSNPALSTEDKILGTKLRVTCSILEGIEDLEAAVKAAVMYLHRLHDLPAIQEAFSAHLDGGFKSMFNKSKRLEIVQAVSIINLELFEFARMLARSSTDLFSWPKIKLARRDYQPVLRDPSIPLAECGVAAIGPFTTTFSSIKVDPQCSAIDGNGDIIAKVAKTTIYKFFAKPTNKMDRHAKFCSFPREDLEKRGFTIESTATDANGNVYFITANTQQDNKQNIDQTLYTFDSAGILKCKSSLEFQNVHWIFYNQPSIAVNKLGQIVVSNVEGLHICICDGNGKLQRKFSRERAVDRTLSTVYLTCSDANEIIVSQSYQNIIYVYTAEGKYNRAFHLPHEHTIAGVAFNHNTKSIILLTQTMDKHVEQLYLLSYAPDADQPQMLKLPENVSINCHLTSHVNGLVALITENGVILI